MAEKERMRQETRREYGCCQEEGKRKKYEEGDPEKSEVPSHKALRVLYHASWLGPVVSTKQFSLLEAAVGD